MISPHNEWILIKYTEGTEPTEGWNALLVLLNLATSVQERWPIPVTPVDLFPCLESPYPCS